MFHRTKILILILPIILSSCSGVIQKLYGLKKLEKLNDSEIIQYSKKYNIPQTDNYKLDTAYLSFLTSLDTTKFKEQIKNHSQPLQVLYYNNRGQVISYHINCYSGGFPNLNWNKNDEFTTFPPRQQAPVDNILPLPLHLKFIQPLTSTINFSDKNYKYVVIVYWSRFMGRQSKRLIRIVQKNAELAAHKVKIIYVNTDNFFALFGTDKN